MNKPLKLAQVEAFRVIMLNGSMTEAAALLGTSQPGVSRLIAQLEDTVKLQLFVRGSPRLLPTAEGLAFYREVEREFASLRHLRQVADAIRDFGTGHLRVASMPSLAFGFLPRAIKRLLDREPQTSVTLQARISTTVLEWTAAGQCDIGIVNLEPPLDGVSHEPFIETAAVCVMPAGHRLAQRRVVGPADLANEDFIALDPSDTTRQQVDRIFAEAGITPRIALETQYAATVCNAVISGLGVSLVNPLMVVDYAARGLIARPFRPKVRIHKVLIFPRERAVTTVSRTFLDVLHVVRDETLRTHPDLAEGLA